MAKNNKALKVQSVPQPAKKPLKKETKESKLQKLVSANANFEILANGKIRCILTKHEFAPTLENFQAYLTSKSYKKGLESQFDLSEYEDFLVPHKANQHFLFCRLTGVKLPKRKTAIERHISSKRFQNRLKQYQEDNEGSEGASEELIEEPEEEEEEEEEEENEEDDE